MSVADDPLYPYRLDALEQTWQVWSQLGGSLSEAQWSAASRCPGWDVACLYAHHSQFLLALSAPPPHAPEVSGQPQSAVQVLRAFNAPGGVASTAAPAVADQAAREAAQHKPAELAERFTGLGVQRALGQPPALPDTALAHTASLLAEVAQGVELIEAATGRSATSPFPVLR